MWDVPRDVDLQEHFEELSKIKESHYSPIISSDNGVEIGRVENGEHFYYKFYVDSLFKRVNEFQEEKRKLLFLYLKELNIGFYIPALENKSVDEIIAIIQEIRGEKDERII